MKIVVVGAGLIGQERILAVKNLINQNFSIEFSVFDVDQHKLQEVKNKYNVNIINSYHEIWDQKPDWVFVCVPHDVAMPIIKKCFENKINVLTEKPLGRNLDECKEILASKPDDCQLQVGFNYRFFDGVEALLEDCKKQKFGNLISVNLILGHGNAPGMENSWKLDLIKCGGGCLIDPGVHLLDLILLISSGDIKIEKSKLWSGVWNTGIEEEAHLLFSDQNKTIFNMQVSLNRWRSSFALEVNGSEGYGIVEGRGRSYGAQTYRTGVKWGWQSGKTQEQSEEIIISNSDCSNSFTKETKNILFEESVACDHLQAKQVMNLLDNIYKNE